MTNDNKVFIDDLVEYFKINTDQIDKFLNSKLNMKDKVNSCAMSIVKDRLKKEVKDMIKYKCTRCGKIWYTETYLPPNQKCICGGKIKSEKEVK